MQQMRWTVGGRIKRLREARGLSRREVADQLQVDVTAVAAWEAAKYLPRDGSRLRLAQVLGVDLETLFHADADRNAPPIAAALVDTIEHLPDMLVELTQRTRQKLRALRLAAPYTTAAYVQQEWRTLVSERLLSGTLEVQRIEIFYDLRRLQETLSNILRYDGRAYYIKSYCPGLTEVVPAMGGYFFDDEEFLLGAYWTGVPPQRRPGLRVSGAPFRDFFEAYWDEIWRRGTLLNIRGAHDLSAVRTVALQLGLPPRKWKSFVEEASEFKIGDGAPPLV
ncbi:helix-turn-helix domain-containing protein [Thiomonas sp.]